MPRFLATFARSDDENLRLFCRESRADVFRKIAARRVGGLNRRNFPPFKNFGVFTMAKKLFFALVAFVAFTASANFVAAQDEAPAAPAVAAVEAQDEAVESAPCEGCEASDDCKCEWKCVACRGLLGCIKYRMVKVCNCDDCKCGCCCAPCCKPVCCKPCCVKVVRCCVPVRCCAPVCAPCCL